MKKLLSLLLILVFLQNQSWALKGGPEFNGSQNIAVAGTYAGALLPFVGGGFCDEKSRSELSDFFKDRVTKFNGGQHNFDEQMEAIRLCAAQKELKSADVAAFFAKQ